MLSFKKDISTFKTENIEIKSMLPIHCLHKGNVLYYKRSLFIWYRRWFLNTLTSKENFDLINHLFSFLLVQKLVIFYQSLIIKESPLFVCMPTYNTFEVSLPFLLSQI